MHLFELFLFSLFQARDCMYWFIVEKGDTEGKTLRNSSASGIWTCVLYIRDHMQALSTGSHYRW